MSQPLVSIVLPTRNGIATLPTLLDAIRHQRFDGLFEVIAVDSASTDGTAELLHTRADKVIAIRTDEFNHGLTRNLGIEHASGDLIVLIVQDALPVSDRWLANLTAPLVADTTITGTFARQRPRADASAITRHYAERAVAASEDARTIALDPDEFGTLPPMERLLRCTFDNVCSCIRRSVWRVHPFRQTPIAEDIEWAIEVLLRGHRLAYVPQAVVTHSHDRSARYEFARTYVLHRRLFELLQVRTIPTLPSLARAIGTSLVLHWRCERAAPSGMPRAASVARALSLGLAWPLGQYLGALSAVRGWKPVQWRTV